MDELARALAEMESQALGPDYSSQAAEMLADHLRDVFRQANEREDTAWAQVASKADWEAFCHPRIDALRRSLGKWPPEKLPLDTEVTGRIRGEGFTIENLIYRTRPGLFVTANLYLPEPPAQAMPSVVICHSHHNPKSQGELQDMGMTWARQGTVVLVMDQLGHGERRQQPFGGREDYHWRYLVGMQLDLVGESLIGWMAWDLIRGVDLLLAQPHVDPERIIMIGAVAGGGDPVAVAAALTPSVKCSVPFNFGRAEGGQRTDVARGAAEPLNFAGSGSWESTRNLRCSARDGFFPWVIVAAPAPRYLVYAHEFAWEAERDPVWERLKKVYALYGATGRLDFVRGWGDVTKTPPEASHCNNVGAPHRKMLYPALQQWFGMPVPAPEYEGRLDAERLDCFTEEARARLRPKLVHELAAGLAEEGLASARAERSQLPPAERRARLREDLAGVLGDVEPRQEPVEQQRRAEQVEGAIIERIVLEVDRGIVVPALVALPGESEMTGVVVALAQEGKGRFLKERSAEIDKLLKAGLAVCLPDLRGIGETRPEGGHAWQVAWNAPSTRISSSALMFGQTLLGARLRDARSVLRYLAGRPEFANRPVAVWGDSFSPVNPASFEDPPLRTDEPPHLAEPMGALVALLAGLFSDDVRAVAVRRGLVGFASALSGPACYIPHDVVAPGLLQVGDVADIAAALAPRPLWMAELVDGRNRAVSEAAMREWLEPTLAAYAGQEDQLKLSAEPPAAVADWLAAALSE